MDDALRKEFFDRFNFLTIRESKDHLAFNCPNTNLLEFSRSLKNDFSYDLLVDLTAVDWDSSETRFSGFYHFYSTKKQNYLRVVVDCSDNKNPSLPSISSIYSAAIWHEREAYDLMGITYENHPNLKRILMWDSYDYHPLRKDFPLAGIESPLPAEDIEEITKAKVSAAPMMGGPFVSSADGKMSQIEPAAKDESWTEDNLLK